MMNCKYFIYTLEKIKMFISHETEFGTIQPADETWPGFMNKVLLEHRQVHLFTYCLWVLWELQ